MLGLGLVLGLFSALLGPTQTRSPMFDRLQRRNNSQGHNNNNTNLTFSSALQHDEPLRGAKLQIHQAV